MDVTYEWSEVGTQILHHHGCHKLRNGLLAKLFFCSLNHHKKVEFYEETSQTTASMSREQTAITLGALQPQKDF